jgi:DNA-binding MarR family transcriptional regulator
MSDKIQIEQALCFNLYTASRLMGQAYVGPLKKLNLTYLQFLVMTLLWEKDNVSLKQLGERLHLDSGTLTPLINRMIDQKLLSKKKSAADGREIFIKLTKKGQDMEAKAKSVGLEMFCKLNVSMDRFVEIREGVRQILKNLENHLNT